MSKFPTSAEVKAELPFFAAWLRDWDPPEAIVEERFGVKAWSHPELLEIAKASSRAATVAEIIDMWRRDWFSPGGPGASPQVWEGGAAELRADMSMSDRIKPLIKEFTTPSHLGRQLNGLVKANDPRVLRAGQRRYRILPPPQP